jgi:hypothetical protein
VREKLDLGHTCHCIRESGGDQSEKKALDAGGELQFCCFVSSTEKGRPCIVYLIDYNTCIVHHIAQQRETSNGGREAGTRGENSSWRRGPEGCSGCWAA